MEKWILAVGYDADQFNKTQEEWLKYGVFIRMIPDLPSAIRELSQNHVYLLVAIFSDGDDFLTGLSAIRSLTHAPILIMKHRYNGAEKVAALEAGADEYIEWPKSLEESVASGRALIRRYTELNQITTMPPNVLSSGDVLISVDYRKVFVHTVEIELPRREFDLFFLLVSNPERVFTPEQLYRLVWGDEHTPTDNGLYACIRRIRRKLDAIPNTSCSIINKRGIGYCFTQKPA